MSVFTQTAVEAATLSITTGGAAQQVFAQNSSRHYFIFSNTSDTAMYLRFSDTDASVTVGIPVAAASTLLLTGSSCPTNKITVFCASTGKTFYSVQGG